MMSSLGDFSGLKRHRGLGGISYLERMYRREWVGQAQGSDARRSREKVCREDKLRGIEVGRDAY